MLRGVASTSYTPQHVYGYGVRLALIRFLELDAYCAAFRVGPLVVHAQGLCSLIGLLCFFVELLPIDAHRLRRFVYVVYEQSDVLFRRCHG